MKTNLDHLPHKQQDELTTIRSTLLNEFEAAIKAGAGGTSEWRKGGQVLKIILFGSYARSDWVDEPENGYLSDFDLLVVVSHEKLTDIADYWWVAEDKILRDPSIGRTVNIIVHTLAEVNQALLRGESFWTDIIGDGVMLYELPGHTLTTPRPMSPADALISAETALRDGLPRIDSAIDLARYAISTGELRDAAFLLHQATERAYVCYLLVRKAYFPRSHNIKFLRSLAETEARALSGVWPRDTRPDRRRFELLKRAYVEARYSPHFEIDESEISNLFATVGALRQAVKLEAEDWIARLRISE